jgi:hypothetical protein
MPERQLQEAGERFDRHFADAHGEFAVADATQPCHMPINRDIVRGIREHDVRPFVSHQAAEDGLVSRHSLISLIKIKGRALNLCRPLLAPSDPC